MPAIYLDNNATTPLAPEAAAAMAEYYAAGAGNPASQHAFGRRARQALEDARDGVARLLGVDLESARPDQLIFTSGGTESNNLALFGLTDGPPGHIVISAIEHPSVTGPAEQLARRGWRVDRLGVTASGVVRAEELRGLLRPDTRLVSVMLGNNETGVLQPVEELAGICRAAETPLHTDAVQVAGKAPLDFRRLNVAAMTCAGHKFHGPVGIGLLALRHGTRISPGMWGGFQQQSIRPGTEAVALAIGLRAALAAWQSDLSSGRQRLEGLRQRLERELLAAEPALVVHGAAAERLPHTAQIAFPGVDGQALQMALDLAGVACSTGSACASGSSEPSPTLLAMGCPPDVCRSSLRFSLGRQTTEQDITEAVAIILRVYRGSRREAKTSGA